MLAPVKTPSTPVSPGPAVTPATHTLAGLQPGPLRRCPDLRCASMARRRHRDEGRLCCSILRLRRGSNKGLLSRKGRKGRRGIGLRCGLKEANGAARNHPVMVHPAAWSCGAWARWRDLSAHPEFALRASSNAITSAGALVILANAMATDQPDAPGKPPGVHPRHRGATRIRMALFDWRETTLSVIRRSARRARRGRCAGRRPGPSGPAQRGPPGSGWGRAASQH